MLSALINRNWYYTEIGLNFARKMGFKMVKLKKGGDPPSHEATAGGKIPKNAKNAQKRT